MKPAGGPVQDPGPPKRVFATTHWSLVLAAADAGSPQASEALEQLCRTYWHPIYTYIRWRGHKPEEAQDLTQAFFAGLLEKESIRLADPARGRFRTFLLTALQHFLVDDWKRTQCLKRGGRAIQLPLEEVIAKDPYTAEFTDRRTPEEAYEERWALTLLEEVLNRMREDYLRAGKARLFEVLQDFLWGREASTSYASLAQELAMTEGAVRVAVHRLREHYRERIWEEVAHIVGDPSEVEAELHYLASVICAVK